MNHLNTKNKAALQEIVYEMEDDGRNIYLFILYSMFSS